VSRIDLIAVLRRFFPAVFAFRCRMRKLTTSWAGTHRPFFLSGRFRTGDDGARKVTLQQTVNDTVQGLGLDLVEFERSAGGLLRVTVDHPWSPGESAQRRVTVEDCERVTRQLQYALEVEGADYRRLEVSSPGIDRPLRDARDFERFEGEVVDLVLKAPIGAAAAAGQVAANRKKFRGTLQRAAAGGWQVVWRDEPVRKPGQRVSAKRALAPEQALAFTLDELQSARLAPVVNFKGHAGAGESGPQQTGQEG
jgi:ribosome maturation factor RimP